MDESSIDDGIDDFPESDGIPERFRIGEGRAEYSFGGPRDLVAWRMAMNLVKEVYDDTRTWPPEERYGLTSQVRRSVVSVPANIAEGHGRSGDREFLHHLSIASGSLRELETLLEVARDVDYLPEDRFVALMLASENTRRPLRGLIAYLRGKK